MSTTVKVGWLKDKEGNKFAPKTLSSQIITSTGELYEEQVTNEIVEKIVNALTAYYTKEEIDAEFITRIANALLSYYTKAEIDAFNFVTFNDFLTEAEIDEICNNTIEYAEDVMF
jgi:hypothetical protein